MVTFSARVATGAVHCTGMPRKLRSAMVVPQYRTVAKGGDTAAEVAVFVKKS